MITIKVYQAPPVSYQEILRYSACQVPSEQMDALLHSCVTEVQDKLSYRVCYRELPLVLRNDACDLGLFTVKSAALAKNLQGCRSVLLFAATVGMELDRLIAKYGRLSPAKALFLQAIGAERIEALCDAFCHDMRTQYRCALRPRFSPGYGDLPLTVQKDIFAALNCTAKVGIYLTDSLLMSPSKSVTAFVGIPNQTNEQMEELV